MVTGGCLRPGRSGQRQEEDNCQCDRGTSHDTRSRWACPRSANRPPSRFSIRATEPRPVVTADSDRLSSRCCRIAWVARSMHLQRVTDDNPRKAGRLTDLKLIPAMSQGGIDRYIGYHEPYA